jgi:hypothetical protein
MARARHGSGSRLSKGLGLFGFAFAVGATPKNALAQQEPSAPPSNVEYLQYGVTLVAETVASPGGVCPADAETPCILGFGGGIAIRVGYRSRGPWYFGGAYELSRHDSSNLLRLAILQQLRAESRYYWDQGTRLTPYVWAGFGGALYGNEWAASTGGVTASIGAGVEFQITESTLLGFSPAYRALMLKSWTDATGQERADSFVGFGLAHLVALELVLEIRDPLARW